jgi:hypothetical protein
VAKKHTQVKMVINEGFSNKWKVRNKIFESLKSCVRDPNGPSVGNSAKEEETENRLTPKPQEVDERDPRSTQILVRNFQKLTKTKKQILLQLTKKANPRLYWKMLKAEVDSSQTTSIAISFKIEGSECPSINEYMQNLFQKPDTVPNLPTRQAAPLILTSKEVKLAIQKLSRNKAQGIDGLRDTQIRLASHNNDVLQKITASFNEWLHQGQVPTYLKRARIIPLSKDDTSYVPQASNNRSRQGP